MCLEEERDFGLLFKLKFKKYIKEYVAQISGVKYPLLTRKVSFLKE